MVSGDNALITESLKDETPCPLCGKSDFKTLYWLSDNRTGAFSSKFREVRCQGCDLFGLRPLPNEADLLAGYERGYGPYTNENANGLVLAPGQKTWRGRAVDTLRRYWHVIDGNATIDRVTVRGRVLDVGAGKGHTVEYLMRRGYEVIGIEPNPLAAEVGQRRGLPIFCGTLESLETTLETFDTVILSQVLEHLVDPRRSMNAISRLLRSGGRVIIFTPNPRGALARVFGGNWGHWHVPYHVYLYGPAQLKKLLRATGFRIEMLRTVSPSYWLTMSFKLWKHHSQRTGWRLPADEWQPRLAIRMALVPTMRALDLAQMGDCLVAVGTKA